MSTRTLLFAHGAGAPSSHPWMQSWIHRLQPLGNVIAFDYPYMRSGRRPPDRLPKLMDAHIEAVNQHRGQGALVLVGKSMGSRVGCHVANQLNADAVVCLGYPLVSSGKTKKVRDEVLLQLQMPIFFAQGTRDPMGPIDRFNEVLPRMTAPHHLHLVSGGDHSLVLSKKHSRQTGISQAQADEATYQAIAAFLNKTCP